jgi:hypothetical protein
MSKIYIFGEGPNDIGRRQWSAQINDFETSEGWLQPIVRRLRKDPGEETGLRMRELVSLPRRGPRPLNGLALKAQIAKLRAASEGCAAVILAPDCDSVDPKEHARRVADIDAGFAAMDADVEGIACVPMGTSEAWLLVDGHSWHALGATDLGRLPRRPEETWGRPHDPESGHPKQVFAKVCEDNDISESSDTRASLAEMCDLAELEKRLPVSFPDFARRVSSL